MTFKEAVENCKKQWAYIARSKHPWVKAKYFKVKKLPSPKLTCYFCEYTNAFGCHKCPGRGILWLDSCIDDDSVYYEWQRAGGTENVRKAARKMVKGCDRILKILASEISSV